MRVKQIQQIVQAVGLLHACMRVLNLRGIPFHNSVGTVAGTEQASVRLQP